MDELTQRIERLEKVVFGFTGIVKEVEQLLAPEKEVATTDSTPTGVTPVPTGGTTDGTTDGTTQATE